MEEIQKKTEGEAYEEEKRRLEAEFEEKLKNELRLAGMSADERAKEKIAELQAKVELLTKENLKIAAEQRAIKLLSEKKLPQEFAAFLSNESWEETEERIEAFEKLFGKAVEEAVSGKLKGRTPTAGETILDPFIMGFMR